MVAEDFLELGQPLAGFALEPVGVALVQLRAQRLRNGVVGGVADQEVAEPEPVVSGELRPVGPDEVLPDECDQCRPERRPHGRRQELGDGATVEAPPLDGGALDPGALIRLEAVDARGEERLQRRRDGHLAVFLSNRHQLFDEKRVALRSLDHPVGVLAEQALDELARGLLGERLERDDGRVWPRCRPRRPRLEQVRACDAEEQDRSAGREAGDILEQVEQRRLCPVHVLDDDDQRPVGGERLEQAAERPVRLFRRRGRGRGGPDRAGDPLGYEFRLLVPRE